MSVDLQVLTVYYLCFFTALWLILYGRNVTQWLRWLLIVTLTAAANTAVLLRLFTHPNM